MACYFCERNRLFGVPHMCQRCQDEILQQQEEFLVQRHGKHYLNERRRRQAWDNNNFGCVTAAACEAEIEYRRRWDSAPRKIA